MVVSQVASASFDLEEVVCIDEPIKIKNTSAGALTYEWNFCSIDLKKPITETLDLQGTLDQPVYMDYVFTNNTYYAFVVNYRSGDLVRLNFGDNLLNSPTVENLGNFENVIPSNSGAGGMQIVNNEGNWYIIIVAGYPPGGSSPRMIRVSFGNTLANPQPTAVDWGNPGNMYDPKDLVILREDDNWYGFTINSETNNITRFEFGTSFENRPVGTNLGNIGNLNYPTGLFVLREGTTTRMYITNGGDETRISGVYRIVRLDFTSLLDESPDLSDVGNVGNLLQHPRDLHILTVCDNIYGLVLNAHPFYNTFLHLNFLGSYTNHPNGSVNPANDLFDFPYSFSRFTSINDQVIGFVVNKGSNSITRVIFKDCNNSSVAFSNQEVPPPVSYNATGIYTIKLTINKGTESESSYCRQIAMQNCKEEVLVTDDTAICFNTSVQLQAAQGKSYQWSPSDFLNDPHARNPVTTPQQTTKYYVEVVMEDNSVKQDSIMITVLPAPEVSLTPDTSVCMGSPVQLNASGGTNFSWEPSTGLSNTQIANPVFTAMENIQYRVKVSTENNCFTEKNVNVSVRPYPSFNAAGTPAICNGESIELSASGGDSYLWTPSDLVADPTAPATIANVTSSTVFTVNITDNVCRFDTAINIPVQVFTGPESEIFLLPNAFTPNGDGKNDCFGIKRWGDLQVTTFTIYNRWGHAVFRTNNAADCWDGTFKGIHQNAGGYLYVIDANTPCGPIKRRGMITLIR